MKNFFKRKKPILRPEETDDEKIERLFKLCKEGDYGLMPSPMDAQTALNELCRYLLGEDWYVSEPIGREQVNMVIVYEIESRFKEAIRNRVIKKEGI